MISFLTQPERVERDTGLSEHQQRERAAIVAMWAWRILFLLEQTNCSARDALRAVEDAEREV